MDKTLITIIIIGAPTLLIAICWVSLMITMRKTTGELKLFLSPDNLVKVFAIYLVLIGTILFGLLGIINGEAIGVIFSGVIGYTVGTKFNKN